MNKVSHALYLNPGRNLTFPVFTLCRTVQIAFSRSIFEIKSQVFITCRACAKRGKLRIYSTSPRNHIVTSHSVLNEQVMTTGRSVYETNTMLLEHNPAEPLTP